MRLREEGREWIVVVDVVCIIVKCAVVTATTGITLSEDRLQTEHTEHMSVNDPNSYSY